MRAVWLLSSMLLPGLAQAGTFQSFDLKRAGGTCGTAIASNGLVAGVFDAPAVGSTRSSSSTPTPQVFLYAAGAFSFPRIDLPAGNLILSGVNRNETGQVTGCYTDTLHARIHPHALIL